MKSVDIKASCDVCGITGYLDSDYPSHEHSSLSINGTGLNIWTLEYTLPKNLTLTELTGICRFKDHIAFDLQVELSADEGNTPLVKIEELSTQTSVFLKDERKNPTGSFKDRGTMVMICDAINRGKSAIAIPSTGSAAVSLCHYGKRAGLETILFVPESISFSKKKLLTAATSVIYGRDLVESHQAFFDFCKDHIDVYRGFPAVNLAYGQGLKTIAYEIFIQLGKIPDWVIIPCGSGGNVVAQYQGFKDLFSMGLVDKLPRMVSVQIEGADPITQGYVSDSKDVIILEKIIESKAEAIASDTSFNYLKIMRILRETNGKAISVTDKEIEETRLNKELPQMEFSSNSVYCAFKKIARYLTKEETVVLIGTAALRCD